MKRVTALLLALLILLLCSAALAQGLTAKLAPRNKIVINPELLKLDPSTLRDSILQLPDGVKLRLPELTRDIVRQKLPADPPPAEEIMPGENWDSTGIVVSSSGDVPVYAQPSTKSQVIAYLKNEYEPPHFMTIGPDYQAVWVLIYDNSWVNTGGFGFIEMKFFLVPGMDE